MGSDPPFYERDNTFADEAHSTAATLNQLPGYYYFVQINVESGKFREKDGWHHAKSIELGNSKSNNNIQGIARLIQI